MEEGVPHCRICLEPASRNHPLVEPCHCTGTMAFVHRGCLREWRVGFHRTHRNYRECGVCKKPYRWRERRPKSMRFLPFYVVSMCLAVLYFARVHWRCPVLLRAPAFAAQSRYAGCIEQGALGLAILGSSSMSIATIVNSKEDFLVQLVLAGGMFILMALVFVLFFVLDPSRITTPMFVGVVLMVEWLFVVSYSLDDWYH